MTPEREKELRHYATDFPAPTGHFNWPALLQETLHEIDSLRSQTAKLEEQYDRAYADWQALSTALIGKGLATRDDLLGAVSYLESQTAELRQLLVEATTDTQWGQPIDMPKGPHSPRGAPTWYCSRCHATNSPTTTTCLWCANPRDPD